MNDRIVDEILERYKHCALDQYFLLTEDDIRGIVEFVKSKCEEEKLMTSSIGHCSGILVIGAGANPVLRPGSIVFGDVENDLDLFNCIADDIFPIMKTFRIDELPKIVDENELGIFGKSKKQTKRIRKKVWKNNNRIVNDVLRKSRLTKKR
ncbi:MAG: hypothetical protein US83_C0004G0051 [Candidatus Falkowbacteria bacterium GW2011_GWC2_38_22]|uniref:Uncharacterized protein n=1 Tax=Candidatus Falkowbacteria bacterium GW2011_GWE1_38_31 TaxID=1618638 RepID=A0A0G0N0D8_9BACT|nr:MAG: hypothetical protein US73_C0002G0066 [Candidatus Falkowbacteria bacterium GW2011_GWF2_38_1205]KKQ61667.1 MAG: hypothetical protein US83_C0004G0051 [Candidatus Falkowbacteria bacterium GW2011_GWC2_38_22]KKQ63718.1 MAG: hypothetical protein US84_C0004G0066 [Candidatus Falkowbacteria bacterium GW2011_GWF1_38_22]KKQ65866.1 MAG: hypothetical protein US87_C0004G0051 [Candidatus Falkowbacteria bacterium GW2011_GWE2_38_254]KKQ70581.1 MAG: hypothetical protein US91_C0004G0066 [Candidatus Falkowb